MWNFITEHWVAITLVVSEVLAFVPGKAKGVVQTIVKVVDLLISTKNTNSLPKK